MANPPKNPVKYAKGLLKKSPPSTPAASWIAPLILAALAVLFMLLDRRGLPVSDANIISEKNAQIQIPRLLTLSSASQPWKHLEIRTGVGERNDLFLATMVPTMTLQNLTQTPLVDEFWPVLDPYETRVAYYGLTDNRTDLFALTLPISPTTAVPVTFLTLSAGNSGLHLEYEITPTLAPAFSPDGLWIAFPAQTADGKAIELFVARTDGQQVLRVTRLAYRVLDYTWASNDSLLIVARLSDSKLGYWKAYLQGDEFITVEVKQDNK